MNSRGEDLLIGQDLKNFLQYLNYNQPNDEYTNELDRAILRMKKDSKEATHYMTYNMQIHDASRRAREEGREEGEAAIIMAMLRKNMEPEEIARNTDLPLEKIESIQKELNL